MARSVAAMSSAAAERPVVNDPPRGWSARHPVLWFLGKRSLAGLATLFVVSVFIFLATAALPGDVAQIVLPQSANPAQVAKLRSALGLDASLVNRYFTWLSGMLHGDFGQSAVELAQGATTAPISRIIATPLRNSMILAVIASVLVVPLSLFFGVAAALRAGRKTDFALSYSSLVFGSLPEFVLGTFLIFIFFSELGLLQPVALITPGTSPLSSPDALILPVLTLLGVAVAFSARQVRAGMIEALKRDYVTLARLHGLPERRIRLRYALRNALAPSVQSLAQTIQYLFGGVVVVEVLYAYPGIGNMLVQAVSTRDLTEVQAIAMILAAVYIVVNILADLLVVALVPKLRTEFE